MDINITPTDTDSGVKIILEADGKALQAWRIGKEDLDENSRVLKAIKE